MPLTEPIQIKTIYGNYMTFEPLPHNRIRILDPGRHGAFRQVLAWCQALQGREWQGPPKYPSGPKEWHAANTIRNEVAILKLAGRDPYALDLTKPIPKVDRRKIRSNRRMYRHQGEGVSFMLNVRQLILAHEPGLGKTLEAIEAIERVEAARQQSIPASWVWVSYKNAAFATKRELILWRTTLPTARTPGAPGIFVTHYEALIKIVRDWPPGKRAPFGIVLDESQALKNEAALRTKAAMHFADSMRLDWHQQQGTASLPGQGRGPYIFLMSGTPAPLKPIDWWSQLEIVAPGFLDEGSTALLEKKLAFQQKMEVGKSIFNKTTGWRNDENKCNTCGRLPAQHTPTKLLLDKVDLHPHTPSINEVALFSQRIAPRVHVRTKALCLDLPPVITITRIATAPTPQHLADLKAAARLITETVGGAAIRMIKLRALSDGFRYDDEDTRIPCTNCLKGKEPHRWDDNNDEALPLPQEPTSQRQGVDPLLTLGRDLTDEELAKLDAQQAAGPEYIPITFDCQACDDRGYLLKETRKTTQLHNYKQLVIKELAEEVLELDKDRLVCFAAFQASVDLCAETLRRVGWTVIKADGRGAYIQTPLKATQSPLTGITPTTTEAALKLFMDGPQGQPVAWNGHPLTGGIGLNLQRSEYMFFNSNDFNPAAKSQAIARFNRIGSTACNLFEIQCLPIDKLILDKLASGQRIEQTTKAEILACLNETDDDETIDD